MKQTVTHNNLKREQCDLINQESLEKSSLGFQNFRKFWRILTL